jgi:CheY-like chemotaxis protein
MLTGESPAVAGRRGRLVLKALIVEPQPAIADLIEKVIVKRGFQVCGIARTATEAVALGQHHKPDLAVIDMELADDERATEVAAQLLRIGTVGLLYANGNGSPVADRDEKCLAIPRHWNDLLRSLEVLAGMVAAGAAGRLLPDAGE